MELHRESLRPVAVTLPLEARSIDLLSQIVFIRLTDAGYPNAVALRLRLCLEIMSEWIGGWIEEGGERSEFTCVIEGFERPETGEEGESGIRVTVSGNFAPMSAEEFDAFRARFIEENIFASAFTDRVVLSGEGRGEQALSIEHTLPPLPRPVPRGGDETSASPSPTAPSAGTGAFVFRLLRDERDAIQVARCAYFSYGYDYPNETIFDPRKLTEANRDGSIISMVAEDETGRIAGHTALERTGAADRAAELGMAFVHPDFRSRGLLTALTDDLVSYAKERGMAQLYVCAVTGHAYSQKAAAREGFVESALRLGQAQSMNFRKIGETDQRVSMLVQTRRLAACDDAPRFVPAKHREMLGEIYGWRGESPELRTDTTALGDLPARDAEGPGVLSLYAPMPRFALIEVPHTHFGIDAALTRAIRAMRANEVECMNVLLPLEPGVDALMRLLEARDYYFGGIQPMRDGRDALLMQRLHVENIDISKLVMYSENAARLAAYVERDRGRS